MKKYIITFTHHVHDVEVSLEVQRNTLNNSIMWQFKPQVSMYTGTLTDIKSIVKDIKQMCVIHSEIGTLKSI